MNHPTLAKFQLGKQGVTSGVIESLNLVLKNHKQIRISVLKSCCRNKTDLQEIAKQLESSLAFKVKPKIIGYTIVLIKQIKPTKPRGKI